RWRGFCAFWCAAAAAGRARGRSAPRGTGSTPCDRGRSAAPAFRVRKCACAQRDNQLSIGSRKRAKTASKIAANPNRITTAKGGPMNRRVALATAFGPDVAAALVLVLGVVIGFLIELLTGIVCKARLA